MIVFFNIYFNFNEKSKMDELKKINEKYEKLTGLKINLDTVNVLNFLLKQKSGTFNIIDLEALEYRALLRLNETPYFNMERIYGSLGVHKFKISVELLKTFL